MSVRLPVLAVAVTALLGVAAPAQAALNAPFGAGDDTAGTRHAQPDYLLNGASKLDDRGLELTPAETYRRGSAFFTKPVSPLKGYLRTGTFSGSITGGTGGNGLTIILADPARGAKPSSLGLGGAALGFGGIPGVAVAFSTAPSGTEARSGFLGISNGVGFPHPLPFVRYAPGLKWLSTSKQVAPYKQVNYTIELKVYNGSSIYATATISLPNSKAPAYTLNASAHRLNLPDRVLVGVSAATGRLTNSHLVTDIDGTTVPLVK